jgi:hypothetical protein
MKTGKTPCPKSVDGGSGSPGIELAGPVLSIAPLPFGSLRIN